MARPTWILCPKCGQSNAKPHLVDGAPCKNPQCLFYFCEVCEHQHLIVKRGLKWKCRRSVRMVGRR